MSIAQSVTTAIHQLPLGQPFSTSRLLKLGSRAAIDKSLSRLTKQGTIERVTQGIYVRPKKNRFIGTVKPEIGKVVRTIAESNGETIQEHGAEAARRFRLSTQVPTQPVFYTSGSTRTLTIGELTIKLIHAAPRKLQLVGEKSGLALAALWYIGKEELTESHIEQVLNSLSPTECDDLMDADKPAWLAKALDHFRKDSADV